MKVKDLMRILQDFNPDMDVVVEGVINPYPVTPELYSWDGKLLVLFDPTGIDDVNATWSTWLQDHDTLAEMEDC